MILDDLPETATDQIDELPAREVLDRITKELHDQVSVVLTEVGIKITRSSWRTKSSETIAQKISRPTRGNYPLADIHGIRIIVAKKSKQAAVRAIRDRWPMPDTFKYGNPPIPTIRNYSDDEIAGKFNPYRDPQYKAIHVNVLINEGAKIGEVQIFDRNDERIEKKTRAGHRTRQGR